MGFWVFKRRSGEFVALVCRNRSHTTKRRAADYVARHYQGRGGAWHMKRPEIVSTIVEQWA